MCHKSALAPSPSPLLLCEPKASHSKSKAKPLRGAARPCFLPVCLFNVSREGERVTEQGLPQVAYRRAGGVSSSSGKSKPLRLKGSRAWAIKSIFTLPLFWFVALSVENVVKSPAHDGHRHKKRLGFEGYGIN